MASIRKRSSGKFIAQIRKDGKSISKTLTTKTDALKWARQIESDIERSLFKDPRAVSESFGALLDRYRDEILPSRVKDPATDNYHIAQLKKDLGELSM